MRTPKTGIETGINAFLAAQPERLVSPKLSNSKDLEKSGIQDLNLRPLGSQYRERDVDRLFYQVKYRVCAKHDYHKSHELLPFPPRKGNANREDASGDSR